VKKNLNAIIQLINMVLWNQYITNTRRDTDLQQINTIL